MMTALLLVALGAPPPEPLFVPDVVVHGRRFVEDEVAPSTVIDRRHVEESASPDLPELLDQQPGLRAARLGGLGSYSAVSVRGSTPDQVLVLIDGIPLNSAEGGGVDLSSIPLGPVDGVVIYRGVTPLSATGSAIGGAVSIHTRRVLGHRLELEVGGGSFETRSARLFYAVGGKVASAAVSVDYTGSAGDFTFINDNGTLLGPSASADDVVVTRQNNRFDQVAALAKGELRLGRRARLTALELWTWRQAGLPGLGVAPTQEAGLEQLRSLTGLRLTIDRIGDQPLSLSLAPYLVWSQTALSDPAGEIGLATDQTRDQSLIPGLNALFRIPLSLDELGEMVLSPAVSASWRYEDFEPSGSSLATTGGPTTRHLAVAAAELGFVADPIDLELVASARFEAALSDSPDRQQRGQALTWRVGGVWAGLRGLQVKLNVARAARFPTLFELFGNTGTVLGSPSLRPESGLNLDIGLVHNATWLPPEVGQLSVEVYGFVNQVHDLIGFVQNSQGVAVAENIDSARLGGIEFGTYAELFSHLRIRGSLTWLSSTNTSEIAARRGKRLPGRPAWKGYARLGGYHNFQTQSVAEIGASVELEVVGGNVLDHANLVAVDARTLLGASLWAGFLGGRLRATLTARNLTNSRVQDLAGYPLPGLTVLGTLRWVGRFGERSRSDEASSGDPPPPLGRRQPERPRPAKEVSP